MCHLEEIDLLVEKNYFLGIGGPEMVPKWIQHDLKTVLGSPFLPPLSVSTLIAGTALFRPPLRHQERGYSYCFFLSSYSLVYIYIYIYI